MSNLLRHIRKKSELKDDADPNKPHATATGTAAAAFFNIRLLRMPRAKTKRNLRPESKVELDIRDNWRNCDPNGDDAVSAYLEVRKSKFKVRIMVE